MLKEIHYKNPITPTQTRSSLWNLIGFVIIFGIFAILAFGASQMSHPYQVGQVTVISLDPIFLPEYALRTVLRMLLALLFSLLVTFLIAPLAAKSKQAEKLIIPMIDILESVPVLGMLSITIVGFIQLFPNSFLGPEFAAIFAIFTSQAWNMILSFYQSLKTTPREFYETATILHLSGWQRFWKIEVPLAIPSLLWNTMISMSAGWFFVVACEAISVLNQNILLPGIGSYIFVAINEANLTAIFYAIFTMLLVILIYDQILFRPLLSWAEKFSTESPEKPAFSSWFYNLLSKSPWPKLDFFQASLFRKNIFTRPFKIKFNHFPQPKVFGINFLPAFSLSWNLILLVSLGLTSYYLLQFITETISWQEIIRVFYLGGITAIKIAILIVLASLIWIPIGVYVGLNPRLKDFCQPLIQFLAAFPVNLIYPLMVTVILYFHLNIEIWTAPLMILGTQWYILFNVIAGTSAIPIDLKLVANNFGLTGKLWWQRLILPSIFPYYVTGAMSAAGGCWNASIVAEVVSWGDHHLVATGIGSYIAEYTTLGDFPRIALGIFVMSTYVILINRLLWHSLYELASKRFSLE